MSGRGRWRRFGAGVVAGGLLAAACSNADGEEAPTVASTPQVSATTPEPPSESPAPGPTPWPEPTRPAAMERDDAEGAKAAAEYFLALYPYVFATGELSQWTAMSDPACQFCNGAADRVTELFDSGGYGLGGAFAVQERVLEKPTDSGGEYRVGLIGTESPSSEFSATGEKMLALSGGQAQYSFALEWKEGDWIVLRGAFESLEE